MEVLKKNGIVVVDDLGYVYEDNDFLNTVKSEMTRIDSMKFVKAQEFTSRLNHASVGVGKPITQTTSTMPPAPPSSSPTTPITPLQPETILPKMELESGMKKMTIGSASSSPSKPVVEETVETRCDLGKNLRFVMKECFSTNLPDYFTVEFTAIQARLVDITEGKVEDMRSDDSSVIEKILKSIIKHKNGVHASLKRALEFCKKASGMNQIQYDRVLMYIEKRESDETYILFKPITNENYNLIKNLKTTEEIIAAKGEKFSSGIDDESLGAVAKCILCLYEYSTILIQDNIFFVLDSNQQPRMKDLAALVMKVYSLLDEVDRRPCPEGTPKYDDEEISNGNTLPQELKIVLEKAYDISFGDDVDEINSAIINSVTTHVKQCITKAKEDTPEDTFISLNNAVMDHFKGIHAGLKACLRACTTKKTADCFAVYAEMDDEEKDALYLVFRAMTTQDFNSVKASPTKEKVEACSGTCIRASCNEGSIKAMLKLITGLCDLKDLLMSSDNIYFFLDPKRPNTKLSKVRDRIMNTPSVIAELDK